MKETKTVTRNSVIIAVISLVAVIVIGAVYVDSIGHEPTYLIAFATTMVVPLLAVLIYQGNAQGKQNEAIQSQVNGNMTARLDAMKSDLMTHIDNATGTNNGAKVEDASADSDPGQSA